MNIFMKLAVQFFGRKLDLKDDKGGIVDTKKWYQSKTILSSILVVVMGGIQVYDKISGTNIMGAELTASILAILGALGIYGRASADTKVN